MKKNECKEIFLTCCESSREEKKRKVKKEETASQSVLILDKYQYRRTYLTTFRGLFRHQNTANCARNKSEPAESKLIVTKESVVLLNRNKHLFDNFETHQVFSTENANLTIEQPFDGARNRPGAM